MRREVIKNEMSVMCVMRVCMEDKRERILREGLGRGAGVKR